MDNIFLLYFTLHIKEDEMGRECSMRGRNAYEIFIGKPDRKRPRDRWEGNTKTHFKETEWEFVNWIYLAQDRD
jgi:hypothetical protein